MKPRLHPRIRLLALLAATALSLGAAACGDGSEDDDGRAGPRLELDGDAERQVHETVEGLYDDLADYDAEAVCARMSEDAQEQIARGAIGTQPSSRDATCAETFGRFLDQTKRAGGFERTLQAEVVRIAVDGDEATATVAFGAQRGVIPLERVDGEWKVGISAAAGPSAQSGG